MAYVFLSFIFLLFSSVSTCEECVHRSHSTYTISNFTSGSCGYRELALSFNRFLAIGGPAIYKDGAGCGACFKIRCMLPGHCKREGEATKVMVVDSHADTNYDFIVSKNALEAMAKPDMSQALMQLGEIDIEYKRASCDYENRNLSIHVEETSSNPYYLAVKLLYLAGQTEILATDVAPVNSRTWSSMRRSYGAVWDFQNMLPGPLKFRFLVKTGFNNTLNYETNTVLPSDWINGVTYDAGMQIYDIAHDTCNNCRSNW